MEYTQAVDEGRRLVAQEGEIRFALGDLALELAPMGASPARTGRDQILDSFAEDIGVELATLHNYRNVANAWPPLLRRSGASWSVHQTLMALPNRADVIRPGMKVGEARQLAGHKPARGEQETRYGLSQLPPERKAEVVREAMADLPVERRVEVAREALAVPEIAERVVRDTPTRTNLARAEQAVDHEQQETAREQYHIREPRSSQISTMIDYEYKASRARSYLDDMAGDVDVLEGLGVLDDNRERAIHVLRRALAAGEVVLAKLESRDVDKELAELLRGDA